METETYLLDAFHEYYNNVNNVYTERIGQREIGFIPFKGTMTRHLSLKSSFELRQFLLNSTPRHLYHSLAFYTDPENRKMNLKDWKGAEYVFDLDADHLEGADKLSYEQILERVKTHTLRLIEKFLLGYLSLDPNSLKLYFSGGRGYHVHINDESFYSMNSDQRREISNLVRGEGINLKTFLEVAKLSIIYGKGWIAEIDSEYRSQVKSILKGEPNKYLNSGEVSELKARLESFVKGKGYSSRAELYHADNSIKIYNSATKPEKDLLELLIEDLTKRNACEIDEPVSTDVHRLIRFPFSLHGKTGLVVKSLSLDHLKDFSPLKEAVYDYKGKETTILLKQPFKINFLDKEYDLEGKVTVPRNFAIFMLSSGRASLE